MPFYIFREDRRSYRCTKLQAMVKNFPSIPTNPRGHSLTGRLSVFLNRSGPFIDVVLSDADPF